jgi:hypothetical protein
LYPYCFISKIKKDFITWECIQIKKITFIWYNSKIYKNKIIHKKFNFLYIIKMKHVTTLSTLIFKWFAIHLLEKRTKSSCIFLQSSMEFSTIYILRSSAKKENLQERNTFFTSLINNRNNKRDKCPPCGTPDRILNDDDNWSNILTCWVLPFKKEPNHDSKEPPTPRSLRFYNNKSWSTKSNALLRSVLIASTRPLFSMVAYKFITYTNKLV